MKCTLNFDLTNIEDEALYERCLKANDYTLALFHIKKTLSMPPDKASKADLLKIMADLHIMIDEMGI